MARAKRWRDAREFYSKALEALKGQIDEEGDGEAGEEERRKKEREIEEACYSNRALCNLSLRISPQNFSIRAPLNPDQKRTTAPLSPTQLPPSA